MPRGTLVAESIRVGATLREPLVVTEVERVGATSVSREQREPGIPVDRTLPRFDVPDADAVRLADALAEALDNFGWYADFHTAQESFVVFAGRVFRYAIDDDRGRAEAESYARDHGVPEGQLDWP